MNRTRWRMLAEFLLGVFLVALCFDFLQTLHSEIRFLAIMGLCFVGIGLNGLLLRLFKGGKG